MTVLTPPAFLQAGTYSALLDRQYGNTVPVVRDFSVAHRARQGFMPSRSPTFTNPAGLQISVSACAGIIANTFATDAGEYKFANPSSTAVTLAAASPTLNRIDVVGFQVKDNFYDASGLNQVAPAVIQGANSAGAPSAPALPSSFIAVVEVLVNALAVTPTSMTTRVVRTTMEGGFLPVANATERNAIGTAHEGLYVDRIDRDWMERYDGAAWRVGNSIALVSSTADRDSAITNPHAGLIAEVTSTGNEYRHNGSAWVNHRMYRDTQILLVDAAGITFSNIPTTLKNLTIRWVCRSTRAAVPDDLRIRINGNTGATYYGSGVNTQQVTPLNFTESGLTGGFVGVVAAASAAASNFGAGEVVIHGWNAPAGRPALSWQYRSGMYESLVDSWYSRGAGLFPVAGPYTSFTLYANAGNVKAGSEVTLYGWE